jgi:hypothetical protein
VVRTYSWIIVLGNNGFINSDPDAFEAAVHRVSPIGYYGMSTNARSDCETALLVKRDGTSPSSGWTGGADAR